MPWSARAGRRRTAAVGLVAALLMVGVALACVIGGHGSRPTGLRLNTDATAIAPDDPQPRVPERVLYVGDSIAWQTSGMLQELLPDTDVDSLVYGGTAPCDWISAVANYPHDVDVVLFSFIGNNLTEATGHATGEALLTQYRDDLKAMCGELAPARCVAIGQPVPGPDVERTFGVNDEPTEMYRHEAQVGSWEFVDAGAAVETAEGHFDPSVREADGVHLNPVGAERFALAIACYLGGRGANCHTP